MLSGQADRAMGDLDQLAGRFLAHLGRRAPDSRTPANYGWALANLRQFLEAHQVDDVAGIREEDLEDWQDAIRARGWAPRTLSLAHTAVRSWLRWLEERDLVGGRLIRAVGPVKVPKGRPRPIPREDLELLLARLGPASRGMSLRAARDRALFHFLLTSSARISEALQVTRDQYHGAVVRQKGGDPRSLRIPPTVRRMIDEYLDLRSDQAAWLWVTVEPGRPTRLLSRDGVNRQWQRLAGQLGIRAFSSHRLRDTGATYLVRKGISTLVVAEHLGHSDLGTIAKYVEIVEEERAGVEELMEELVAQPARPRFRSGVVGLRKRRRSARVRSAEK